MVKYPAYYLALEKKAFQSEHGRGRNDKRKSEGSRKILHMDPFLKDIGRILNSKALRRLQKKTQVAYLPDSPYVRNRLIHTTEVAQAATTISASLGLNLYLTQAIAWGHDLGHVALGHEGEDLLSELLGKEFKHEKFGPFVLQYIEYQGKGLNLNFETLQGISFHSSGTGPMQIIPDEYPNEYSAVMYADKMAYLLSDINDLTRAGLNFKPPVELLQELGPTQEARLNRCIRALCKESAAAGRVLFTKSREAKIIAELKAYMYKNGYPLFKPTRQGPLQLITWVVEFLAEQPEWNIRKAVLAVALMTEEEIQRVGSLLLSGKMGPKEIMRRLQDKKQFGIGEVWPVIEGASKMDFTDPHLKW